MKQKSPRQIEKGDIEDDRQICVEAFVEFHSESAVEVKL
jgi:hypothetical protein